MRALLAIVLVIVLFAPACGGSEVLPVAGEATLTIATQDGPLELAVQVADTEDERATGLTGREELAPYDGMVFTWPEPTDGSFTMRNTLIPLSIAFWNQRGQIVAILDMEPCEAEPCPSYRAGRSHIGAVEVEQGLFEEHGIEVGAHVELAEAAG